MDIEHYVYENLSAVLISGGETINTKDYLANFETIYYSPSSIIFKAVNVATHAQVIVKSLNREIYDSRSLSKLKHEFALLQKLQSEFVVHAYDIVNLETRFLMVIEDFGAVSLDKYLNTKHLGIKEFLDIAVAIARCLDYIHRHRVIHKDLNPSNIVYNPDNKILKLIDFGIATEFSFETMQVLNPNKLEGRLPYISPEQTGRMNRPLDYRTDFYSLGVTLYELASGQLPFVSSDPAEILHCHLAKTPLPLHLINPEIPRAVSAIIDKLMAKMPEERYKNAAGIIYDLNRCLEQLESFGLVKEFELGTRDISNKLEVPKKLYGREYELSHLLASFENISQGEPEFILIGGYSGIGKTSLVNELHKTTIEQHGMFISGKYDQYSRNTPYSAFFQAIEQFCSYVLSSPETEIQRWKTLINEALGLNGRLLTEAVPRLGLIIGEQPRLGELSAIEEQTRFKLALRNWVTVISSPEQPVVFFMDDIHWADIASLELFESLFVNPGIRGFMFVGTYRDNHVNASHPLVRSIETIKNNGRVSTIKLENLDVTATSQIISDITKRPVQEVWQLSELVHSRTMGNPFYTIAFLKYCNDRGILYYDQSEMRWDWNKADLFNSPISDNVADYLIDKIKTLPEATQALVKIAACIGNHFEVETLAVITGKDAEQIKDELKPAIYEEMIYVVEESGGLYEGGQFEFCHDKFRQVGYLSLPEQSRKNTHLHIARYYEKTKVLDGPYLFITADHYAKALDCLHSDYEVTGALRIFFKAAHTANLASAYDTARQYLQLIMETAPSELKNKNSFLLPVYKEYHLVLFSLARFAELDEIYNSIEEICTDPLELVDCCCLQLVSLSNRSRYQEGFQLGVKLLERLGICYPQPNLIEVVEAEYGKYCKYEQNGAIENIAQKEKLVDSRGKAIAKLLNRIVPAAQFFDPLAAFWATLVNANLMIENGITGVGLEMAWTFFMGVIAFKNDFRRGNLLAEKAMAIVEKEGLMAESYRIFHVNGLVRCHWFEPVEHDIEYAHKAFKGNLQNGEFEFACFSYFTSLTAILESGGTIAEMEQEVEAALAFAGKMGNLYGLESFVSFKQLLRALRGETQIYGAFDDDGFSEAQHIDEIQHNAIGLAFFNIYRSLSAVLFGDFTTALHLTEHTIILVPYFASFYIAALFRFLHSLAICRTLENVPGYENKHKLLHIVHENQEWMYQRAKAAPCNYQHLYDLIDAEIKVLEGKYDQAFRLFELAILGAKDNHRPYHYALFCELAGQRYHKIGIERVASVYLKEAHAAFLGWGATGKTEAMKNTYQHIIFSGIEGAKLVEISAETASLSNSVDMIALTNSIDINAVIKATQTISVQMSKKKLLKTLMNIIIENSGSNRGYILLGEENNWVLSAYETVNKSVKTIIDGQKIILENKEPQPILPISMITYVVNTREPIIIGNMQESHFWTDEYFRRHDTTSAMCFPVLFHNLLKGIIYLENYITADAFSQERLEVLNIFASQAAVSLENSILYSALEDKVKERTSQLEKANRSLKEKTAELAVAMEKAEEANKELEVQNLQLQHEIMVRKRVEEELNLNLKQLRLSEERFYKVFYNSPIMMALRSTEHGIFIDVNSKWEEITGYSRQEIIGRSFAELDIWADPCCNTEDCLNGKNIKNNAEKAIRTRSGEIRTFIISQTAVNLNNEACWLTTCVDISEHKLMEQEIARLDRLNLVGEMAASIGHEIRNPMTSVRGFLQMFENKYSEDKEFLNLMIEELDRANSIITEFLSLAKNKIVELIPENLNSVLNNILPLLQATATIQDKSIKLYMEKLPVLRLDKKEIRQLVLNLVNNGLDSMPPGGTIAIRTLIEGDTAVLSIKDQGSGISPDVLDKLGTPFFTTKEKGTGLGLAVCYGIAARHNASIEIETGSGGTTVSVRFPLNPDDE
ncbi:MAG: AAA family ATPase [Syntrophomonadaceae bacterium]|nr:AAA family ATPase [Syntrophomonadaceae bacterium]